MANTLKDELSNIIADEQPIADNKVANFGYEDEALANPQEYAQGVTDYDYERPNNIPEATANTLKVNATVLKKGFQSKASSVTRMLVNHFFGRVSYNLNKTVELVQKFFIQFKAYLGAPNGVATLDANGRVPASQLPETALEYQGNWNASDNTITNHTLGYDSLINGTGTKGDLFLCEVEGWFNASTGECSATKPEPSTGYEQYFVNDRVVYDGASWNRLSSGDIKKVNGLSPVEGNVQITHKITQAQYNQLTTIEKQGKFFVITDIDGSDMYIINDEVIARDTTWSSARIQEALENGGKVIPITWAGYQALTPSEKIENAIYAITDKPAGGVVVEQELTEDNKTSPNPLSCAGVNGALMNYAPNSIQEAYQGFIGNYNNTFAVIIPLPRNFIKNYNITVSYIDIAGLIVLHATNKQIFSNTLMIFVNEDISNYMGRMCNANISFSAK